MGWTWLSPQPVSSMWFLKHHIVPSGTLKTGMQLSRNEHSISQRWTLLQAASSVTEVNTGQGRAREREGGCERLDE